MKRVVGRERERERERDGGRGEELLPCVGGSWKEERGWRKEDGCLQGEGEREH